ncbi:MAG: NADPH-dependent oxidoreductase [Enterococcus sp.]
MELFDTMIHHSSVREFTDQAITPTVEEQLLLAAQSASSSNFLQAFSLVKIVDPEKRKKIETIARFPIDNGTNGNLYLFVADLNKHAQVLAQDQQSDQHLRSMESLVVSIVDTAIAAQSMAVYAESIDLGICYVGGIRNDLFAVKELLDLPELTYPLFGLFVGHPAKKNEVKPRLPLDSILKTDTYHSLTPEMISRYDQQTADYYQSRNSNIQKATWSQKVQQHFAEPRRQDTAAFLQEQGFLI